MSELQAGPDQVIRIGDEGEPTLYVTTTSRFEWVWSDAGSGAHRDVTVWRPTPQDPGYYTVGDYAQGNYNKHPNGQAIIVKPVNDDPDDPLVAAPIGYRQVWNDQGSGGKHDGAIWFPVPPDGYVSLGYVAGHGYHAPAPRYACLRQDWVHQVQVGPSIWSDAGSGAGEDVTLYPPLDSGSAFVAQGNYEPWTGQAYALKSAR